MGLPIPPSYVTTAVLRGGFYDGLELEIEEGQGALTFGRELLLFGTSAGERKIPQASYRFAGDIEGGRAVFVLQGDA